MTEGLFKINSFLGQPINIWSERREVGSLISIAGKVISPESVHGYQDDAVPGMPEADPDRAKGHDQSGHDD